VRHGVVNFLALLNLYNGKMRSCCLEKNDSEHLCKSLPTLLQPFHSFNRVHLIWDGGPSHVSAATKSFLKSRYGDWVRVVSTPAHSSWLNQAEILLKCFEVRYLRRGNWTNRQHWIDHLNASTPEYNRLWAHPITGRGLAVPCEIGPRKSQLDYVKLLFKRTTRRTDKADRGMNDSAGHWRGFERRLQFGLCRICA
jgi:hypothetical protein